VLGQNVTEHNAAPSPSGHAQCTKSCDVGALLWLEPGAKGSGAAAFFKRNYIGKNSLVFPLKKTTLAIVCY
jgi:hypothetical protein